MYGKTIQEMTKITIEAERRVRAGEPRAEVARALGIPLSTLSTWAHRGGWRRKDLVAVRDTERAEVARVVIADLTIAERERKAEEAAKMRDAIEASKAELEAIAPAGYLPGAMGEGPVPARKLAIAMADSLLRQGRLEDADRAIRLAVRFAEAEQADGAKEEAKWREERERLTKWWAEKQTAYHKLHQAAQFALEEIEISHEQENSRAADDCCPKCGRRMDFWPKEVERPDDDDSGDDDSVGRAGDDDSGAEKRGDDFNADLMFGDDDDDSSWRPPE